MGVNGLVAFMKSQPAFVEKYRLHDTKLVIDASNLYHFIYFNYYVPYKCGGDYHIFAAKVKLFFELFKKCGIVPYLVFDGGYETDQKKLKTCLDRARKRIHNARTIAQGKSGRVTPAFASETFRFILIEIGIPFVISDFEADGHIASLANQWNCPVLSNDSDFFIFHLEGGFILLDHLDLSVKMIKNEDSGKKVAFLECNMYNSKNFIKVFPGLDTRMLPLLSTICGNDYFHSQNLFINFLTNLSQAPDDFGTLINARKHNALFLSLLYWLKNQNSLPEAIGNITRFMKMQDRKKATRMIFDSVNSYNEPESSFSLKEFFEKNQIEFSVEKIQKLFKGNPLPNWFLVSLKQGEIPVFFLNTLRLRRHILLCQVENLGSESTHTCSRYIRQIIYGILLLHDINKFSPLKQSIVEYDRSGMNYYKNNVESVFELDNFGPLPSLNDISEAPSDVCKQIILSTLGVSGGFLELFKTEFKLVAATMIYWVKNASPRIQKSMVSCLIACMLYLQAKLFCKQDVKQKEFLRTTLNDDESMTKLFLELEQKEMHEAVIKLGRMCGLPSTDYKKQVDTVPIHSFNQFQSCLRYVNYLNALLRKPFQATSPHLVFCGTFLYNIFQDVHHRSNPQEHIAKFFGPDSVLGTLFTTMDNAFHSLLEASYLQKEPNKKRKRHRNRKKNGPAPNGIPKNVEKIDNDDKEQDYMYDVENRFSSLGIIDS